MFYQIIESEGRVMIGDSIANFNNDELIFIGSNLPHVWHNSTQYFSDGLTNSYARSVSLFIHPEKIQHIFREPENIQRLKNFFLLGKRGMKFGLTTKAELSKLLIKAVQEIEEIRILIVVLEILNLLCNAKDYLLLSSPGYPIITSLRIMIKWIGF
ncbi:hypothetical protein EZ428_11545 [Pedobacter frigiditerrae]|uniref:Uncharacterized protein n=1 Tax=Pedobacter frigiditerrae TaxID=2530452 RepID=A0A4R0MZH0_9SPHI|nr:hypothetical protein [Pedobacter frigiditerrae]TCC92353.1 hypothetical protein EZ428_11545 [Pedobacter frigiditerrae]